MLQYASNPLGYLEYQVHTALLVGSLQPFLPRYRNGAVSLEYYKI